MDEIKCPCINCITLGICKGVMGDQFSLSRLADRCSIFDVYYHNNKTIKMPTTIFLLDLFKPLHYKRRIALRKEVMKSREDYGL